jgi:hypothetical protein
MTSKSGFSTRWNIGKAEELGSEWPAIASTEHWLYVATSLPAAGYVLMLDHWHALIWPGHR